MSGNQSNTKRSIVGKVITMSSSTHTKKFSSLQQFLTDHLYSESAVGHFALGLWWILLDCHFIWSKNCCPFWNSEI